MLSASHKSMYSMSCEPTVRPTLRKGIQHALRVCMHMRTHAESCMQHETYALPCTAAWHGTGKHGGPRARPHTRNARTHTHGMDCACRCVRIARLVRAVRDFGSAARRAAGSAFSSTRASRDAGPVFLNTTPHTKRLPSRRCGCRPLPKRLQSIRKNRLEAAPHPFWTTRFYKFQILFSGSALLAARS